jgi:hypothetical protein
MRKESLITCGVIFNKTLLDLRRTFPACYIRRRNRKIDDPMNNIGPMRRDCVVLNSIGLIAWAGAGAGGIRDNHVTKWFGLLAFAATLTFVASVSADDNVHAVLSLPRLTNLNARTHAS